jgi:predicted DNA binding CopG/RHH family protein
MPEKRRDYKDLGDFEMPPDLEAKVEAMIAQADEEDEQARVNFRWSKEALEVVKQAAKMVGIPYQTYMKQTVFEHSLSIIEQMDKKKMEQKNINREIDGGLGQDKKHAKRKKEAS